MSRDQADNPTLAPRGGGRSRTPDADPVASTVFAPCRTAPGHPELRLLVVLADENVLHHPCTHATSLPVAESAAAVLSVPPRQIRCDLREVLEPGRAFAQVSLEPAQLRLLELRRTALGRPGQLAPGPLDQLEALRLQAGIPIAAPHGSYVPSRFGAGGRRPTGNTGVAVIRERRKRQRRCPGFRGPLPT